MLFLNLVLKEELGEKNSQVIYLSNLTKYRAYMMIFTDFCLAN